jgi:hypothetical protein
VTYHDVELPEGRVCDRLRRQQDEYFSASRPTAGGAVLQEEGTLVGS